MLLIDKDAELAGVEWGARQMCIAARTAPKGKGKDLLVTAIVSGPEKDMVSARMRAIGETTGVGIFLRDAANVDVADVMVLLGSRKEPLGISSCGLCGFADCGALLASGGWCSFNVGDLGIALGSAVSRAADLRLDNRIMYTVGKAVLELDLLGKDVALAYGIPLSATGKSPFFDRSS